MSEKRFGIEIELTGVSREEVVGALENFFQTEATEHKSSVVDNPYTYHKIKDSDELTWTVLRDRSIVSEFYSYKAPLLSNDVLSSDTKFERLVEDIDEYKVEIVSPVLTSKSLHTLFSILDIVKSLGGLVNDSTGIHVHVDAPNSHDDLVFLLKKFFVEQETAFTLFNTEKARLEKYCKAFPTYFIEAFNKRISDYKFWHIGDVLGFYYAHLDRGARVNDVTPARYYAMNLDSIKKHNTVEFRFFNSTLDRREVAKILDWVLHFCYNIEDCRDYTYSLGMVLMQEIVE